MKSLLFLGGLALTQAAFGVADEDYLGPISKIEEGAYVRITSDNLTCVLRQRGTGYIDIEWATATLVEFGSHRSIFPHTILEAYAQDEAARQLCAKVDEIKAEAEAQGGYVEAVEILDVETKLHPAYGRGCYRVLKESAAIKFRNGLIVRAHQDRRLSGGSADDADCRGTDPLIPFGRN